MTQTATTLAADLPADPPAAGSDPKAAPHNVLELAAALSANLDEGFIVQIGTELMRVLRRGMETNPEVERGYLGTGRVAHDAAATVTPVQLVVQTDAPTAPPPATAGGTAQTVSRLDATVTAAQLTGRGGNFPHKLFDLPDGAVVIDLEVFVTVAFDTGVTLVIDVAPQSDLTNGSDISPAAIPVDQVLSSDPTYQLASPNAVGLTSAILQATRATGAACLVVIEAADVSFPLVAGSADIIALIATPA